MEKLETTVALAYLTVAAKLKPLEVVHTTAQTWSG